MVVSEGTYSNARGVKKNSVSLAGRIKGSKDPIRKEKEETRQKLLSKMSGAVTDVSFGKAITSIFRKLTVLLKNKTHDKI